MKKNRKRKTENSKPKVRDVYGEQLLLYMYLASHTELRNGNSTYNRATVKMYTLNFF